jgi:hypothetical protein
MKQLLLCSIAIILITTSASVRAQDREQPGPDSSSSFNVSVGFRSHFSWWDPVWSRIRASKTYLLYNTVGKDLDIPNRGDFLYNPFISFQFNNRWALSASYLYGHYIFKTNAYAAQVLDNVLIKNRHRNSVDKHDADLLLNCSINRWVKVFFGLKYQSYIIKNSIQSVYSTKSFVIPSSDNIRFHSGGGGLGLGFTVPLGSDFYIFPSISGILLAGRDFAKPPNILNSIISSLLAGIDRKGYKTFVITGAMGSLSLAYHIKAIRLTIEAGGRGQYLYYTQKMRSDIGQRYDLFFGPYLSVIYSFF